MLALLSGEALAWNLMEGTRDQAVSDQNFAAVALMARLQADLRTLRQAMA